MFIVVRIFHVSRDVCLEYTPRIQCMRVHIYVDLCGAEF